VKGNAPERKMFKGVPHGEKTGKPEEGRSNRKN